MKMSRTDRELYSAIAEELGLSVGEVKRAVVSFFDEIAAEAASLPFNNARKIFSREKFNTFAFVKNLPYIGRIGPSYNRYLKWRANESKGLSQESRSAYRDIVSQDDIENMAGDILSGRTPLPLRKTKGNEMYNRVWLVGQDGKKLARQVIRKKPE